MVVSGTLANSPRRHRMTHVQISPFYPPGIVLVENAFYDVPPDAEKAYRLARLRQIGAPQEYSGNNQGYLDYVGNLIGPERRLAGDAWALETFQRDYHGKHWQWRDLDPCTYPKAD